MSPHIAAFLETVALADRHPLWGWQCLSCGVGGVPSFLSAATAVREGDAVHACKEAG